jgi:hypothetical protein
MKEMFYKYKPGASIRIHLLIIAVFWSVVGLFLIVRAEDILLLAGKWWIFPLAAIIGTAKSFFVLDQMARKNINRTLSLKEGTCIGGVYSWRTWGLVVFMILLGISSRLLAVPQPIIGFIYLTVGWSLFWSSRLMWQQWQES